MGKQSTRAIGTKIFARPRAFLRKRHGVVSKRNVSFSASKRENF